MLLGIDYGLRNVGLAISEGDVAEPLKAIKVESLPETIRRLGEIREKLGITKVIIGISEGKSKDRALGFGKKLETMLRLPVEYIDETLTTHEANLGKSKGKKREHAVAAAIILQRYLDNKISNYSNF